MDLIKELSENYPKAWSAFVQWCYNNSDFWPVYANVAVFSRKKHLQRYLLADLQAWLDSVGRYCDAFYISTTGEFIATVDDIKTDDHHKVGYFPIRPEALKASVFKGCEIYETQNT